MNPEYLQRYEEEMREKKREQMRLADRADVEWEREKLLRDNAELLAALKDVLREWYDPEIMGVIHPTGSKNDRKRQAAMLAREVIAKAEGK